MKRITGLFILFASIAYGQSFDARSLSLAGNSSAHTRGIDAIAWNPANLANSRGTTIELNILSFNAALYNSSFSLHNYNKYFSDKGHGGHWSTAEKNEILDLIPDDGLSVRLDQNANLFGLAFNNFGFAMQLESMGKARINDKYPLEVALFGESIDTTYGYREDDFADADFYSTVKMTVGYAYPIAAKDLFDLDDRIPGLKEIAIGVNFNYYMGLATVRVNRSSIRGERVNSESVKYDLHMETESAALEDGFPAGRGIGFDLGLNAKYQDNWHFSLAFKNILAGIKWTNNPERIIYIESDSTNLYEDEDIDYSFSEDTTIALSSFRTPLPKSMLIGAEYTFNENLTFTMDWHQALDSRFGNSTTPRIGFGTQYLPLGWLALRGGIAIGGKEGFLFGVGSGLNFSNFQFDLAYGMNKALWPTYARGVFAAMTIKIIF